MTEKPMRVPIRDIHVPDRRARKDAGDLTELQRSIREVGLLHPVVVTPSILHDGRYRLIAGWRRLMAVTVMGMHDIPVTVVNDLGEYVELAAERDENTARKDLTPSELAGLVAEIAALEKPKAIERQKATRLVGPGIQARDRGDGQLPTTSAGDRRPVRDIAAAAAGSSARTIGRINEVIAAAENEAYPAIQQVARMAREKMDAGTLTVNAAWQAVSAAGLRCSSCQTIKPDDEFNMGGPESRRGRGWECRSCSSQRHATTTTPQRREAKERQGDFAPSARAPAAKALRLVEARKLAAEGYTSPTIAEKLGVTLSAITKWKSHGEIDVPADRVVGKRRRVDWNRVMGTAITQLRATGLDDVDYSALDATLLDGWIEDLKTAAREVNNLRHKLEQERSKR